MTKLTASDTADGDRFGLSVAISGDAGAIVVGAYGEDGAGSSGSDRGAAYMITTTEYAIYLPLVLKN